MTESSSHLLVLSRGDVRDLLGWDACIALVKDAMVTLSNRATRQLPRAILGLGDGRAYGVMAGTVGDGAGFGAKLVSVYPENLGRGLSSHQGVVVLHDPTTGAPACIADASEVTRIRTAAASAVATDVLARRGTASLAILGYGHQAEAHAHAIARVREISDIRVWGRDVAKAAALAERLSSELGVSAGARPTVAEAVEGADIVCTTTAAAEPILHASHLKPGAHVNLVGSSRAGPAEADVSVVVRSRFVADCRENVILEGAEFRNALAANAVTEDHIAAEIGEILGGTRPGRTDDDELTVYKSLGHIVQDIAALRFLHDQATAAGRGTLAIF